MKINRYLALNILWDEDNEMKTLSCCPYCQGEFLIKEVACAGCHTQIKGDFVPNRFHVFDNDSLFFIEIFLKCEGNIKLVEKALGISYPTVKNRLKQIIQKLGYELPVEQQSETRLTILQALSDGHIDTETAMQQLSILK